MNILEFVADIHLPMEAYRGILPDAPDTVIAVFEYSPSSPDAYFDATVPSYAVQVRSRSKSWEMAYNNAVQAQNALDRYVGEGVAIRQTSSVLDIGQDSRGRREYTVNFKINSTGG